MKPPASRRAALRAAGALLLALAGPLWSQATEGAATVPSGPVRPMAIDGGTGLQVRAGRAVAGTVLHGITGEAVSDAEVAFLAPDEGGQLAEIARQAVDAGGHFSFAAPFLQDGQTFVLVAFYGGIPFPSAPLAVGQQSAVLLEVFDATERDDDIAIVGDHHFVAVDGEVIDVAQLVEIENRGEAAYVGSGSGPDRHVTEFILPRGLVGLENHNSDLHQVALGRYFDSQPLVPGTTQIAFSFRLPVSDFDGLYVHQVVYPTESLDFYIQPPSFEPGSSFEDLGLVQVHDRQYRHLRLRQLAPGQSVQLRLPVSRPVRWAVKWLALGLGLVGALAAILLVVGRTPAPADGRPDSPAGRAELEARRRAVLGELASLAQDDDARREELMAEAVALYRALDRPAGREA